LSGLKIFYLRYIYNKQGEAEKKKNECFRLFKNGWVFLDMAKLQHCNNREKHMILEFAGNRQNLPLPTQGQAVLLTCLSVHSLRFVPSTYGSVLESDSTLLTLYVLSLNPITCSIMCSMFSPPAFIYLFSSDSK